MLLSVDNLDHVPGFHSVPEPRREKRENVLEDVPPPLALEVASRVGRPLVHNVELRQAILEHEPGPPVAHIPTANGGNAFPVLERDNELVEWPHELRAVPCVDSRFHVLEIDGLRNSARDVHNCTLLKN